MINILSTLMVMKLFCKIRSWILCKTRNQYSKLYEIDADIVSYENHNVKATLDVYLEDKKYIRVVVMHVNLMSFNNGKVLGGG